jgi:hypothetical protein
MPTCGALLAVLAWLLAALATPPTAGAGERMPLPPLGTREQGEYRAREAAGGEDLWRTRWAVTREQVDGRPIIRLEEDGRRLRDSVVPATWSVRMRLDLWGAAPRLSSTREARNAAGRPTHVEQREFDYAAGTGRVSTTDLATGEVEVDTVPLTPESVTGELLPAALRLLPGRSGRRLRLNLVTRGGRVIGLEARVVGRERLDVPAGAFDCFKVELDPTGFVGLLADLVLPRLYMWHTLAAPHFWVKYQGPEGGLGSRRIVRELVRFETDAR